MHATTVLFSVNDIDVRMEDIIDNYRPYCPVEPMDSEDFMFILYTSGTIHSRPERPVHLTLDTVAHSDGLVGPHQVLRQ